MTKLELQQALHLALKSWRDTQKKALKMLEKNGGGIQITPVEDTEHIFVMATDDEALAEIVFTRKDDSTEKFDLIKIFLADEDADVESLLNEIVTFVRKSGCEETLTLHIDVEVEYMLDDECPSPYQI